MGAVACAARRATWRQVPQTASLRQLHRRLCMPRAEAHHRTRRVTALGPSGIRRETRRVFSGARIRRSAVSKRCALQESRRRVDSDGPATRGACPHPDPPPKRSPPPPPPPPTEGGKRKEPNT